MGLMGVLMSGTDGCVMVCLSGTRWVFGVTLCGTDGCGCVSVWDQVGVTPSGTRWAGVCGLNGCLSRSYRCVHCGHTDVTTHTLHIIQHLNPISPLSTYLKPQTLFSICRPFLMGIHHLDTNLLHQCSLSIAQLSESPTHEHCARDTGWKHSVAVPVVF